jgi:hypothetical protein
MEIAKLSGDWQTTKIGLNGCLNLISNASSNFRVLSFISFSTPIILHCCGVILVMFVVVLRRSCVDYKLRFLSIFYIKSEGAKTATMAIRVEQLKI